MLSPLRNRFGIPGAISVIALVFAMLGGAYAASNDGGGKATASAKGKRGPRGPKGATGPAGPAGPQGPAGANGKDGANGSNGAKGEKGDPGTNGTNGTDGEPGGSPEGHPFAGEKTVGSVTCHDGGIEYEVEATGDIQIVCNGAQGAQGPEGSPWTLGGTLPEGQTEKGTIAVNTVATEPSAGVFLPAFAYAPISFPIPLAAQLNATSVHFVEGLAPPECPGSTTNPKALPGHLCVFASESLVGYTFNRINKAKKGTQTVIGALTQGADIVFNVTAAGEGAAFGSWAVTAFKTPVVTEVSPNHGPAAGGTAVTIKGENFTSASVVKFGASQAAGTVTVSPNGKEITGVSSPAGSAGEVDVTVTNPAPAGASAVSAADKFTYE